MDSDNTVPSVHKSSRQSLNSNVSVKRLKDSKKDGPYFVSEDLSSPSKTEVRTNTLYRQVLRFLNLLYCSSTFPSPLPISQNHKTTLS